MTAFGINTFKTPAPICRIVLGMSTCGIALFSQLALCNPEDTTNLLSQGSLQTASKSCDTQTALVLIEHGASVTQRNTMGWTPLHTVAASECDGIAKILIAAGADINAQDDLGLTPVQIAINFHHKEFARMLIAKGAATDIYVAAGLDDKDAVSEELKRSPHEVNTPHRCGMYPLHWAANNDGVVVIEELISSGADVNARDDNKMTPLLTASAVGNASAVDALIKHGADLRAVDKSGWTALHWAAHQCNARVVKLLLAAGIEVNHQDYIGNTALHLSLDCSLDVIHALVNGGANPRIKNGHQETALQLGGDRPEVLNLLSQ